MKHLKKMMALVVALVMVLAMSATVFAGGDTGAGGDGGDAGSDTPAASTVKIEIEQDSTYAGDANDADGGRVVNYYKVFSANYGADFTGNNAGGGYDDDGTPGAVTGDEDHPVAYTASSSVAEKLGSWDAETKTWTKATGNLWFKLTPIAGSTNYSVEWDNSGEDADTVQAAAKWLKDNQVYDSTGTLTYDTATKKWSKDGLDKGYYIIESIAGDNLIAATTDITIKEKNDYPPLDKTQADEDASAQGDANVDVAVGDEITYQVKVTIPKTAKVGDKILVWDKAYQGLEYVANSLTVKSNEGNATVGTSDYSGDGAATGVTWQRLITVTSGSQGKDVIFEFKMKVTSDALTSTDKKNESGLKYGRGEGTNPFPYESTPDEVEYKTYFAGIEKVDGQNASIKLEGVKFTLKEGDTEFKVSKVSGKDYYIPDANGSSEVVTAADGTIKIRGLDEDKTYTLTETENPNEGYNMLAEPVTLTLSEDTASKTTYTPATEYDASATYYTKDGDNYVTATVADAEAFAAGTYYTAETTGTSSYDGTTADTWQDVINNKGTILPSTGGIGTTLFYVIGAILVIGAGVLLVTRRRMNAN
jgi:fimbrial isopeptide formation D2 family protein/LPXTG-motif cell wall-anchored protein